MKKTALITGATSGIGLAFARKFASLNYDLIITGTRGELENVSKEIESIYSVSVLPIIKDIKTIDDINELLNKIKAKEIHVLINNAGYALNGLFYERPLRDYLSMINLHIILTLKLIEYCLPIMIKNNDGKIINISSDSAYLPIPGNAIYSGTKAFIKQFTECLYLDIRKRNINIKTIVICPGLTKTEFHGKMNIPKERQKNKGIIRWSTPEKVVEKSLRDLDRNKVISKTGGFSTFLQVSLYKLLPRQLFYKIVLSMFE